MSLPAPLAGFEAFDQLATMVAVVDAQGRCLMANSTLENVIGVSRRTLQRGSAVDWLVDPAPLRETLRMVALNEVASGRFDGSMRRFAGAGDLSVHVLVSQTDRTGCLLVEMVEIEQQTRQDREDRAHELVRTSKELVRNLAHEIKNPLGGIRGAAQLLAMELDSRELTEYTQVIIQEADRLQVLVDRLLAPHRRPRVLSEVNIHEICERVRSLVAAEFPRGLAIERDYDASIPEFMGDREQLIQTVLNVVRNAAQALVDRMVAGDGRIVLRTRVVRHATIARQRVKLALELHIQDNGPGVPDTVRDRLFHPLVSGREGGSGLGLMLAQTFVQQHQGTIECDSIPGRTLFKIMIPLS